MNLLKRFKCNTCDTEIDCRIGMSNRDIQPFQFACPACEEVISFVLGVRDPQLSGAEEVGMSDGPFNGSNPFVDLHLDFPVSFGEYQIGITAFMRVVMDIGHESYFHLNSRLNALNALHSKQRDLQSLITQYKRADNKAFRKICKNLPGIEVKSDKKEDVLAALYSATSLMSSPFTIHKHNEELSESMPRMLNFLYFNHYDKTKEFFNKILENNFLKNLQLDCLSLYPKILDLDLPCRPALYFDYADIDVIKKIPARVSGSEFEACSNFYKDLSEVFSRQLILLAGINNLFKRGDFDIFDDSSRINSKGGVIKDFSSLEYYADVDLGRKVSAIDDSFYHFDLDALDNKLRNAIAHYKYEYKQSTQLITYYPSKEGMERLKYHEIYFLEFMRKILLLFREVHCINHIIKSIQYFAIFVLRKNV